MEGCCFAQLLDSSPALSGKSIGKMLINMVRREKRTPEKWFVGELENLSAYVFCNLPSLSCSLSKTFNPSF